jgi:outer membrane putative beta-barrel porin/alpha-amylase
LQLRWNYDGSNCSNCRCYARLIILLLFSFLIVGRAAAQSSESKSLDEVNKELSNPTSSIWALQLQENTYWLNKPERNVVNLQFQPVLPVALTGNWNLVTRPVFQVMNSTPYVNKNGNLHRVTGFGDTILATLISPSSKLAGPWLLGAGPSFIFPTASNSRLGQNKWQIGPTAVFGYLGDKWLAGVFSSAMVFGGWAGLADYQPNERSAFLCFPTRGRMGRGYVPEPSRQLVREQKWQYDYLSTRSQC